MSSKIKTGDLVKHAAGQGPQMTVGVEVATGFECNYWAGSEKGFISKTFRREELILLKEYKEV